jgi:hypothetical protein
MNRSMPLIAVLLFGLVAVTPPAWATSYTIETFNA